MAKIHDYSTYEPSKYEKELQKHKGNDSISFAVFQNKVIELKDEKALTIYVDDFFDSDAMNSIFAEDEGHDTLEEYLEKFYSEILEFEPNYFEDEKKVIEEQKKTIEFFSQKFDCFSPPYSEDRKEALITALAGAVIKVPLGEGLLDFCYAPFAENFKKSSEFYSIFSDEVFDELRTQSNLPPKNTLIPIENKNRDSFKFCVN